ncbi:hypothetical protein G8759_31200 [Spirosoma aureum]|uniref:Uncharacterized protein n=1 Tax=Spirosoma aureum TaxID=2692134 RepID=A0A6G9AWC8_9BACT|nr:hypothetical protein [Spirosoma aureum]QIP16791.1 hypothetical protein G8759_31200 [Spirosoma aureum]
MKYKIDRQSPTGQQLFALYDKMNECRKAAQVICQEVGSTSVVTSGEVIAGGIWGFEFPDKPNDYKRVYSHGARHFFFPKAIRKFDDLLKRIRRLPVVQKTDINQIVGFERQVVGTAWVRSVGCSWRKDYCLIDINEKCVYTPRPDMIEITTSEYNRLKDETDE